MAKNAPSHKPRSNLTAKNNQGHKSYSENVDLSAPCKILRERVKNGDCIGIRCGLGQSGVDDGAGGRMVGHGREKPE